MIKLVFIIFNLMGIMAYHFTYDKITVNQETPEKVGSGESFVVKLQVNKGNYNGFAKWQQELPKGFRAEMMETRGATFSFKDNVLKLIWLEMPDEESFFITYRIVTEPWIVKKQYSLEGRYSYIYENERKDFYSNNENIVVTDPSGNASSKYNVKKPSHNIESIDPKSVQMEVIDFDSPVETILNPQDKATSIAYTQKEEKKLKLTYKVQIAAGHFTLDKSYFKKEFSIEDYIDTEIHNGWKKYTVGNFSDYKSAREKRNSIWVHHQQPNGAFVTAYLYGKRISIQEALKISEEQWIK